MNEQVFISPHEIIKYREELEKLYPELYKSVLHYFSGLTDDEAAAFMAGFLLMYKCYRTNPIFEAAELLSKKEPFTYFAFYLLAKQISDSGSITTALSALLYVQNVLAQTYEGRSADLFQRFTKTNLN